MTEKIGVFICYRRLSPSTHCAGAIRREIQHSYPSAKIFHDGVSLEAGARWPDRIRQALDESAVLIAVIDENWATMRKGNRLCLDMERDWVREELVHALTNDTVVIPVLVDPGTLPVNRDDLPDCLHPLYERQAVPLRDVPRDMDSDLAHIVEVVGRHLPAAAEQAAPKAESRPIHDSFVTIDDAVAMVLEVAPGPQEIFSLAESIYESGAYAVAEILYKRAAEQFAEKAGPEEPWVLAAIHNSAIAAMQAGRPAEAEAAFRDLLPLRERVLGPDHQRTLTTWHEHAVSLVRLGRLEEAEAALGALLERMQRVPDVQPTLALAVRRMHVRTHLELGRIEAARAGLEPLPRNGGEANPLRKGQTAMLRAWLADLDGDAALAQALLDQAETHLTHLSSAHYARRDLARYQQTRVPGGAGGTMLWTEI